MNAITGFAHVELSVSDIDASSRWYCALLGAREVFRAPDEVEDLVACAIVEPKSGVVLAFTQHHQGDPGRATAKRLGLDHVSFAVADLAGLEAWATRLDELNIEHSAVRDYGYAHAITFSDPDGIPLEFFWQKPRG
jgi:catechol 2,3-dioxygenase-like lactoylglutathione lyase family enzyme